MLLRTRDGYEGVDRRQWMPALRPIRRLRIHSLRRITYSRWSWHVSDRALDGASFGRW